MKRILLIFLALLFLTGCTQTFDTRDNWTEIGLVCGIDTGDARELGGMDSHGGFHGDGCTYTKIEFEKPPIFGDGWRALPMSEAVATLCYGIENEYGHFGPYMEDGLIPEVENGYYFFMDRHSESDAPYDDSGVLKRASFNFTVAVYDTDTDLMYYVKMDT